jgi:hypothetical protein
MESKYGGKCPRCKEYYPVGTEIESTGGIFNKWRPVDCKGCKRTDNILELFFELKDKLIADHKIAYGCWGIPEDCKPTFSRIDWFNHVEKLGWVTPEQKKEFEWYWRGLWHRDLSD